MRTAIVSDLHANLEALQAVFDHIDRVGVDRIVCLGDLVGYGADPRAVVELVRARCAWTIMGNHDKAAAVASYGLSEFNPVAARSAIWTRGQLGARRLWGRRADLKPYLAALPETQREGDVCFVHGTLRSPVEEYLVPSDAEWEPEKMRAIFELIPWVVFCGHTHKAGIHEEFEGGFRFLSPSSFGARFILTPGKKVSINVGAVGQPRDHDWRASWVLFEGDSVTFQRCDYDLRAAQEKIRAVPELDDLLADRLALGR